MAARAVGICGSYGGLNAGDEAILTATIAELRAAVPKLQVTVFSRQPEHTREHQDADCVLPARETTRADLWSQLGELDLLLLGGGGLLYDREAEPYLHLCRVAQSRGVPTATYAIGAGPLQRPAERRAVADVLNRMDLITVREHSAKTLLEEIGVEQDVVLTADPALLLVGQSFPRERLERQGVGTSHPLVGMSVREPGAAASGLKPGVYHKLLADAADYIVSRFDADVLFVPMEGGDLREAHRVVAEMACPERAFMLKGDYRPGELLSLMDQLHMAVGMRLHFLIFAAVRGVPIQGLPYASKVMAFLERLGISAPTMVQAEHAGVLLASLDHLWDHRDGQRAQLEERLPDLQAAARQTTKRVVDLLDSRRPKGEAIAATQSA